MITKITHAINMVRHSLRDIGVSSKRSTHWPTVEKHFLEKNPNCAACGSSSRLNVHHIKPFHLFPELELDENNLITLCMGEKECHIKLGHLNNFKLFNEYIKEDAAQALNNPNQFGEIIKTAMLRKK
jgi:5-methylcytosine-specific restriction endonuclease McrA